jgi:hypothetical protein
VLSHGILVELVASPAELDRGLGDVDAQHAPRPEVALDIGSAAATAAADLQNIAVAEVDPRRYAMVEVDRVALFLVLGRQFWTGSSVTEPDAAARGIG